MPKKFNMKYRNVMRELVKNGRISDKEIAKKLGYSQPTVTRIRKKLEIGGYIFKYCAVPDLNKIGYELAALTAFAASKDSETSIKKAIEWTMKNKKIVFASGGEGFDGRTHFIVTIHKNFTEYEKFMRDFRKLWMKRGIVDLTTFLVPTSLILKFISFEDLF